MAKIFITMSWFLPATGTGNLIQSVARLVKECNEGMEYFIFCSDIDVHGGTLENITTGEWVTYNDQTKVWYAGPQKISNNLVEQVESIKPDVLYIVGLYSWYFNLVPLIFCKAPKKILSVREMLGSNASSQKKWRKNIYLRLFKLFEYEHKVTFHALDTEEEAYIRRHFGKAAVIAIAGDFPNDNGIANDASEAAAISLIKRQYIKMFTDSSSVGSIET